MHDAIVYTNTHLDETVNLVSSYTGVAPNVISRSVRPVDPEYIDPKNIQPVINLALRYKLIDHGFSADDVVSPSALRKPNPRAQR